jgi:hypothetical protein
MIADDILRSAVRTVAALMLMLMLIASLVAGFAGAQVPTIPLGTRVRLDLPKPNDGLTGTLTFQSADEITISTRDSFSLVVAVASVRRIDVSGGVSHPDGTMRGMKIGGLGFGGVMAALLIADAVTSVGARDKLFNPLAAIPYLVPPAVVVGGLAGGIVGGLVGREHWDTVYSAGLRVSVLPAKSGAMSVGLSMRF